jgi:TrmH family RNA methyltransferase
MSRFTMPVDSDYDFRMDAVTSASNPLLKEVRKAVHLGRLTDSGLCVAEGFHLLEEALRSDCRIEAVLVSDSARDKLPALNAVRVITLEERLFATLASTETSQGVIALVHSPSWTIDDICSDHALAVILDGVQDPGNAGAILRAAEAFGATGAVFLKGTVNPYNPKALRASGGSVFRLPHVISADPAIIADQHVRLYAAMPASGRLLSECDLTESCAIVIGSEARGVSPELAARAEALRIPTSTVESLNAAISAAVILYEARRQRSTEGGAAQ